MQEDYKPPSILALFSKLYLLILLTIVLTVFLMSPVASEVSRVNYISLDGGYTAFLSQFGSDNRGVKDPIVSVESLASINTIQTARKFIISDYSAQLAIPSANISGNIVSGNNDKAMNQGFWLYPSSSVNHEEGNTVIIGHRFLHVPPRTDTFYNLDKVKIGDTITIKTTKGEITYKTITKKVIEATDVSILDHTSKPRLILITCHPLWTSRQRLVIMAELSQSTVKL